MSAVQLVAALLAAVGGLGGLAASFRARAQSRLDDASSMTKRAEAESIAVDTARDLIAQVRDEMERRVTDLSREVSELRGRLEGALAQRDHFREEAEGLHRENRQLREQVEGLKRQVADLAEALTTEREHRRELESRIAHNAPESAPPTA